MYAARERYRREQAGRVNELRYAPFGQHSRGRRGKPREQMAEMKRVLLCEQAGKLIMIALHAMPLAAARAYSP